MDHLAVQVGLVHHVEVDQAQPAHARGGEVKGQGRAQAARADEQHRGSLQLLLAGHAHFRHDQVPRVAQDFFVA
jgi:hypothetical protein